MFIFICKIKINNSKYTIFKEKCELLENGEYIIIVIYVTSESIRLYKLMAQV